MDDIYKYWNKISKDISNRNLGKSKDIWNFNNFKDDIITLKNRLGITHNYINFLGIFIDINSGIAEDKIINTSYNIDYLIIYLFYYSKSKDVGIANEWVKYYNLLPGLTRGIIPFQEDLNNIKKQLDENEISITELIEKMGGIKINYGDIGYILTPLPFIKLLFIYNYGDDEFESDLNVLFDKNVIYYLPLEMIWGIISFINNRLVELLNNKKM